MRKLYFFVITGFLACVLLFVGSFLYLDRQGHDTYYYIVSLNGRDIGSIKIDRFATEDKLLYKSSAETPFEPIFASDKIRMALDRKYALETYLDERSGSGAAETLYIANADNAISFVSIARSKFAYMGEIPLRSQTPARARTFVFKEDAPVTYLPLLENYDFSRGKSQGFSAITQFSPFLPPMKRFVTLTSVRNEYLKIEKHRIKTECLLLKIKNYPPGTVWVARSDRSIIMIDLPSSGLKIRRTFSPKKLEAAEYAPEADSGFEVKAVTFNNKALKLAGTIYLPKREGNSPAILLVWGDTDEKASYRGLFSSMAAGLAKEGYAVLTFDKRGIGASEGDSASATDTDTIGDINAAIDFLKIQKNIDPDKIVLIGHSKGSFYSSVAGSKRSDVKALVFISPKARLETRQAMDFADLNEMAAKLRWNAEYLKSAMKSRVETLDKLQRAKRSHLSILGKRCFADKMREELAEDPVAEARRLKMPVLTLQGKDDTAIPADPAAIIDKAVDDGGNKDHMLTYFDYLGHFPGASINDGTHKIHYVVDAGVVEAIKKWLDKALAEKPVIPAEVPATGPAPQAAAAAQTAPAN